MHFTYAEYIRLLNLLKEYGYEITDYYNWDRCDRCAILRHDVDNSMERAFSMAQIEHAHGIASTYFVLLTSNFYNVFSRKNRNILNEIQGMGHMIGLHFDEMSYPEDTGNLDKTVENIKKELSILSEVVQNNITVFSYHRPAEVILNADIKMQGVVNSYGNLFFKKFKYLSDSRMYWREPVTDIIQESRYSRLHILTHPFWYHDEEQDKSKILRDFINAACLERYDDLNDNFTNLDGIILRGG